LQPLKPLRPPGRIVYPLFHLEKREARLPQTAVGGWWRRNSVQRKCRRPTDAVYPPSCCDHRQKTRRFQSPPRCL